MANLSKVDEAPIRKTLEQAPEILTDRLRLRGHTVDDFRETARLWAEPDVVKHITGQPSTRTEAWSRLLRYLGLWRALGYGYWAVDDRSTGKFLGEVGIANYQRDIEPRYRDLPEVGWVLRPEAQGRGLATEAGLAITRWADRHLDAHRTIALFTPDHDASMRVAVKLGYHYAGQTRVHRQSTVIMQRDASSESAR